MTCNEAQELITAFIDRELPDREQTLLQAHLKECVRCQVELETEQALKQKIRAAGEALRAPVRLRERIVSDARAFPPKIQRARGWREYVGPMLSMRRAAAIAALVFLSAMPFFYFRNQPRQPLALAALESSELFFSDKLPVIKARSDEELVEQLVRAAGGSFHPMGYDLSALNLRPVAGAVREIQGRKVLIVVYRGPDRSLLCYTFLGSEQDAPGNAARFFDAEKKMNFFAFSRGAVNAVLHREGDVICILAAKMPMEHLLALTKSKARPS